MVWITEPKMKTSAQAVANYFIEAGNRDNVEITHLKLQKLVYYSQAWYLGNRKEELFSDDIEAWPHGPVIRSLYFDLRDYGASRIEHPITTMDLSDFPRMKVTAPVVENSEDKEFLVQIWNTYKGYGAIQLSNMSHAKDEPWDIVRLQKSGSLRDKPPIPTALIRAVFEKKVAELTKKA